MAYIGKEPIVGNFQKCDAITVVNGQAAYTLQVSSTNVVPESASAFASNKFTVPSGKAGKYFFVLHWNSNTSYSNEMFAKIFKNGSLIRQMRNQNIDEDGVECCAILDLADGDYIEGYARATNNATNVLASTDKTWFDGFKLIG
jgi:hypothetical protein